MMPEKTHLDLFSGIGQAASPLHPTGPDTEPLASAKSTRTANESSESTGQMSLFGMTCECSEEPMYSGLLGTVTVSGAKRSEKFIRKTLSPVEFVEQFPSSPPDTPASHSLSPGSDWARRMTATSGRRLLGYLANSGPAGFSVRTLLDTSTWASTTCYLTWKRSATKHGRLLFRLVPSTPRTGETGFGLWGTPTTRDYKDTGDMTNVPVNGLLGRQVLMPTPDASNGGSGRRPEDRGVKLHAVAGQQQGGMKLNSAWVGRMMGYPDGWLILDGEVTP